MNPEDTAKPVDTEPRTLAHPQPEAPSETVEPAASEEMKALAKALMVKLLWSQVGLLDEKRE